MQQIVEDRSNKVSDDVMMNKVNSVIEQLYYKTDQPLHREAKKLQSQQRSVLRLSRVPTSSFTSTKIGLQQLCFSQEEQ